MRPCSFRLSNSGHAGSYYARVTNAGGSRNSATVTLTVKLPIAGVWNFDNGDLSTSAGMGLLEYADGAATQGLTKFETTDGSTVPHINGQPAKSMRVPAFTAGANGYALTMPGLAPNGGGGYVNQYTMLWDVLLPGSLNWMPFFNTAPGNGNDADFYVPDAGALGIGVLAIQRLARFKPTLGIASPLWLIWAPEEFLITSTATRCGTEQAALCGTGG